MTLQITYLRRMGIICYQLSPKKINGGVIRINSVDIWTIGGKHTGSFHVVQDGEATTKTSSTWEAKNYHSPKVIFM
jgi:hypothetical protein